ncbi:MAG TPA: cytochrome c oxidase subunit II [Caulobacteraceae bacterium]|jgi:cytochrome c oxidase subunit 2|nr:cytochrome c oxidase subunit II [Caulobacteraceae bacterium]
MKVTASGISRLTAGAAAAVLGFAPMAFADILGQPVDRGIDLQGAASHIRAEQVWFHNWLLSPIIIAIAGLVLVLLLTVVVRFNKRANPEPARFSHNTAVEIAWTVIPVLILMFIAIFSFRLLYEEHDMPRPYMTVKVTGRQWNWDYEYPDQKIAAYTSTPMSEEDAKARRLPYLLEANLPMYVPVNQVVRLDITAEDVIHSFSVPAFGVKIDAIPGRLNQTWFKADRTGVFYGQCSQLCGANHSYMPIEVKVVNQADFNTWVASKQPKPAAPAR